MASQNATLICRWGGEFFSDGPNVQYSGGNTEPLPLEPDMTFNDLVNEVHSIIGSNPMTVQLNIKMKFESNNGVKVYPCSNDRHLKSLRNVVLMRGLPHDIYVELVPMCTQKSTRLEQQATYISSCPPLRALTFDVLGLVKVIEARSKQDGVAKVVERWGDPDSSKAVLAASINDWKSNPLLAVARKNGAIEVLSPVTGELCFSISDNGDDITPLDDPIAGLHLFKKRMEESPSRSCTLFSCTTKGKASLRRIEDFDSRAGSISSVTPETWNVCGSGQICCSKVHADEIYFVFGGKGIEINMWDLEKTSKIWSAKSPPADSLGIFTPTWFTSLTFLRNDDHRKVVAGTRNHQVRLYDTSAQRRPVLSIDFRETPITSVAEDLDGHTIYVGNGSGDLGSFDIRTGKLLGCFLGKCSGSIRSITRHHEHSIIASCGLDSYVRFWDINTRQLLYAVFLKQHLTNVVFDSNFSDEETAIATDPHKDEIQVSNEEQFQNEEDARPVKRKKDSKEKSEAKKKKIQEIEESKG